MEFETEVEIEQEVECERCHHKQVVTLSDTVTVSYEPEPHDGC